MWGCRFGLYKWEAKYTCAAGASKMIKSAVKVLAQMKNDFSTIDPKILVEFFRTLFLMLTENESSDEDEETLLLKAGIVYRAMELITEKRMKNLQHQPISKAEFENWFRLLESPVKDVYQLVYARNLFEEIEGNLLITGYGKAYEEMYWASFR
jgi:hypothetical protein